jgi:hypothetical protein
LKRREIITETSLEINTQMINLGRALISVLMMPLAIIVSIVVLLSAIQIAIHETLWKNKKS